MCPQAGKPTEQAAVLHSVPAATNAAIEAAILNALRKVWAPSRLRKHNWMGTFAGA